VLHVRETLPFNFPPSGFEAATETEASLKVQKAAVHLQGYNSSLATHPGSAPKAPS